MLKLSGRDAQVLPCTSIFARDNINIDIGKGDYIVVNYMENGGHYTFGQKISSTKWYNNFSKIVEKLEPYGRVIAACHDKKEMQIAEKIAPNIEKYILPNNYMEYMRFYSRARFGIVNRVHAGFMMASFGRPCAVIGNDSRALMMKNLQLPTYFVEDVNSVLIDTIIHDLLEQEDSYRSIIEEIRVKARTSYTEKITKALYL